MTTEPADDVLTIYREASPAMRDAIIEYLKACVRASKIADTEQRDSNIKEQALEASALAESIKDLALDAIGLTKQDSYLQAIEEMAKRVESLTQNIAWGKIEEVAR